MTSKENTKYLYTSSRFLVTQVTHGLKTIPCIENNQLLSKLLEQRTVLWSIFLLLSPLRHFNVPPLEEEIENGANRVCSNSFIFFYAYVTLVSGYPSQPQMCQTSGDFAKGFVFRGYHKKTYVVILQRNTTTFALLNCPSKSNFLSLRRRLLLDITLQNWQLSLKTSAYHASVKQKISQYKQYKGQRQFWIACKRCKYTAARVTSLSPAVVMSRLVVDDQQWLVIAF